MSWTPCQVVSHCPFEPVAWAFFALNESQNGTRASPASQSQGQAFISH